MTFSEFWQQVKGFNKREELHWARTYRLWCMQVHGQVPSFDEFMGRKPVLSKEDKFAEFWEMLQRDRADAKKVTFDA